ncbi:hypothetical protein Spb1_13690 [Planctopirus ephydatiae]|uniref:Uncharacterized protein n=1 Tax=Planctopirus ephydatiae TaxID=2528019 RepID=A0A518GLD4_9PLAN|nr:hypothetical protein [Planctopirus ephydatiae]QDV29463.1 hypothetical protein Spb1_13690 [Planctopirus ephydatiae]
MSELEDQLREIWEYIPDENDLSWIDRVASQPADTGPLGDFGTITRRMLAAGVSKLDIARFAKINAYEAAFGALFVAGNGLHELLLSADPTGREMRPPTGT